MSTKSPSDCLILAKDIIFGEVEKLSERAKDKDSLDKTDADILNNYVKSLMLLNKDEREEAKSTNLQTMTDDELEQETKLALDFLSKKDKTDEQKTTNNDKKPKGDG